MAALPSPSLHAEDSGGSRAYCPLSLSALPHILTPPRGRCKSTRMQAHTHVHQTAVGSVSHLPAPVFREVSLMLSGMLIKRGPVGIVGRALNPLLALISKDRRLSLPKAALCSHRSHPTLPSPDSVCCCPRSSEATLSAAGLRVSPISHRCLEQTQAQESPQSKPTDGRESCSVGQSSPEGSREQCL